MFLLLFGLNRQATKSSTACRRIDEQLAVQLNPRLEADPELLVGRCMVSAKRPDRSAHHFRMFVRGRSRSAAHTVPP